MAFRALTFVFDNIPSETYELYLGQIGGGGVMSQTGSCSVELYTQTIYRKPKPYFFGTQMSSVLTFELQFLSMTKLSAIDEQNIQRWLFGHQSYKKLQICQCDMQDVYFNCFLTDPEITTVGNYPYQFKCKVICDAPWAWEFPKKKVYNNLKNETLITFNNTSDDNYYMYPKLEFTLNDLTSNVSFKNTTDDNSGFTITGALPNEKFVIDCNLGIITSSSGLLRFDNFKGSFLRFLPRINKINVIGGLDNFTINYQNARKVGG